MADEIKQLNVTADGMLSTVSLLDEGEVARKLDTELRKGLASVRDFSGKTEITLTITVSPVKGMESALSVIGEVKAKHPQPKPAETVLFRTQTNGLAHQMQKQTVMRFPHQGENKK